MYRPHKIAYAFVAYDDAELLEKKIKFLYTSEDLFIVHWNRYSSKEKMEKLKKSFQDYPNVHIYSKVKVVWGTYTILLAVLENMKLALNLMPDFEHFISLSEQCAPVKTKEYIKRHLVKYRGKSFCASVHLIPEVSFAGTICAPLAYSITRYAVYNIFWDKFPFWPRCAFIAHTIGDFFMNLIPILKRSKQICQKVYASRLGIFADHDHPSGPWWKRKISMTKYRLKFALYFIYNSLRRAGCVGMYGRPSKLVHRCCSGAFQMTKSPGPAACYCREDVEFLCRKENIRLAKKMKRYNAPEEYFCQTILYNSQEHRKNFLQESLCATDYSVKTVEDILKYLDPFKFRAINHFCSPTNYQFAHICFLRKVYDHRIFDTIESILNNS